jgi:hypothetical protein
VLSFVSTTYFVEFLIFGGQLDFFIDIDQNRIKYQNEKMFHIHGSKIINFIHEKLFNSEILFKKLEELLQDFELNITYARVDDEVARTSLKELYFDLKSISLLKSFS